MTSATTGALVAVASAIGVAGWFFLAAAEGEEPTASAAATDTIVRGASVEPRRVARPALDRVTPERTSKAHEWSPRERALQNARDFGPDYAELAATFPEARAVEVPADLDDDPRPARALEVDGSDPSGSLGFWYGTYNRDRERTGVWRCYRRDRIAEVRDYRLGPARVATFEFEDGELVRHVPRGSDEYGPSGVAWTWYPTGVPRSVVTWRDRRLIGPAVFFTPDGEIDEERTRKYTRRDRVPEGLSAGR